MFTGNVTRSMPARLLGAHAVLYHCQPSEKVVSCHRKRELEAGAASGGGKRVVVVRRRFRRAELVDTHLPPAAASVNSGSAV